MTGNGLLCADVLLRNYSLARTEFIFPLLKLYITSKLHAVEVVLLQHLVCFIFAPLLK